MKATLLYSLKFLAVIILLNAVSFGHYYRFDLTQDKRYSLALITKSLINKLSKPLTISVYLEGDFPLEFKRLQTETQQLLQEFSSLDNAISFRFINPLSQKSIGDNLIKNGLRPSKLTVQENGEISEKIIFPWAVIAYNGKKEKVNLLSETQSTSQEQQINEAISKLEYAFAEALSKIVTSKKQSVAVIKGNGEIQDIYLDSFLRSLVGRYNLAPFTLDSVAKNPQKTLKQLRKYDLAIIAKPTEKFTESEKYTLDQFVMNQGKILWLIDNVQADLDSMSKQQGEMLAYPRALNITDLLFSYGVRISYDLVADLYSSKIRLASGFIGNKTQFQNFNWHYFPLITSENGHPISKHILPVQLKFATAIDTLKNSISKTVLLQSSLLSKKTGTPRLISLNEINTLDEASFNKGSQILGVLLSGAFKSAYKGRVKPFDCENSKETSLPNSMVIISDGDIIANQVFQDKPTDLNSNRLTGEQFGNKDFLRNTVNYLLGNKELLNLRSKALHLRFLNKNKLVKETLFWQLLNVVLPLLILALFGFGFNFYRKLKYAQI
ncbi:MAG: gliding motility-associated ABC transporter substrate-binding protein GldG [Flavobacteriaceae bacterium]|nr:gliding motility-associated ABC transporter substrate-binding protein GldG [Flavobacteriaceae bacterium]